MMPEQQEQKLQILIYFHNQDLLAAADDPVAAVRAYLAEQQEDEG